MQRIRVTGGVLTSNQWRGLADIIRRYTPDTPLHLTTRQDLEFHNLVAEQILTFQQALAAEGLTGLGACGDTVRNITVCPCSGVVSDSIDLHPLAADLQNRFRTRDDIFSLPRKFKISLSCCTEARAQPWINDLGFTVCWRNQNWGFRVTAGGSLGAKPATAIVWKDWLDPLDAPACALAGLSIFDQYGDRQNRHRARLRHLREKIGDVEFLELLDERFRKILSEKKIAFSNYPNTGEGNDQLSVLPFPNGDLSSEDADAIASLIDQNHTVRIGNHHRILVFSDSPQSAATIGQNSILTTKAMPQPTVVACPGRRWCKHGLTDTHRLADKIRNDLKNHFPPNGIVSVSGCPNHCAQSAVADIGLTGQVIRRKGQTHQAYTVWIGGGNGQTPRLGQRLNIKLPENEVIDFLRNL